MEQIIDVLLKRLACKNVLPDEVPWLIRDVLNAVGETGEQAVCPVNRRLAILGWDEELLDEVTFALIISFVEECNEDHSGQRVFS